jgi:hypothetical protein
MAVVGWEVGGCGAEWRQWDLGEGEEVAMVVMVVMVVFEGVKLERNKEREGRGLAFGLKVHPFQKHVVAIIPSSGEGDAAAHDARKPWSRGL